MERAIAAIGVCALLAANAAEAQTLRGSRASMDRQFSVAVQHDYSFLDNAKDVSKFVGLGLLVPVRSGTHFELAEVSYPYARPGVRTFIDRLSSQYYAACRERLVVTSLTRPTVKQPRNASDQSVHPAGMAVDLRISRSTKCRNWLEKTLLALEKNGVLDATRERRPAHYHIAIFPQQYLTYIARLDGRGTTALASNTEPASASSANTDVRTRPVVTADAPQLVAPVVNPGTANATPLAANATPTSGSTTAAAATTTPSETVSATPEETQAATVDYRVHRGDTLWSIAKRHGTSVQELKALNNMNSTRIAAGQVIVVPAPQ